MDFRLRQKIIRHFFGYSTAPKYQQFLKIKFGDLEVDWNMVGDLRTFKYIFDIGKGENSKITMYLLQGSNPCYGFEMVEKDSKY